MAVTLSLIGGITETGASVSAGSASILAAISIEGDDDESQTSSTHTYGTTSFTNTALQERAVGSNAIYARLGHIVSPSSGPETYTSLLSGSPPSIGHSTVLLAVEGADGSDLIDSEEHIVQSSVNVFPTHTFSAVAGQAVVIVVQANKSGSITPPADNGGDSWTELLEPWFIGGAFVDGAVFKLEATETHSSASAQPGDSINGFITSSHLYVFNEAAGAAESITADAGSYAYTGTDTPIIADFKETVLSASYSISGTTTPIVAGFNITSDTTSYSISGTDINLRADFNASSENGSYSISGTVIPLSAALNIIANAGSYVYTGTDVTLVDPVSGDTLIAEIGNYTYTGTSINLLIVASMTVNAGSYIITGTDVNLIQGLASIWTDQPLTPANYTDQAITPADWIDNVPQTTIWTDN